MLLVASPLATVLGAGFGELTVQSYLNQPFRAEVALLGADEARNLAVDLAGPSRYTRMMVQPPQNLRDYSASLTRVAGRPVVQLRSRQPVTDLVVDLILVMQADGSEQVRHYPVLIDFAPTLEPGVTRAAPPPEPERPAAVPPPARSTVQATDSGVAYGPVRRGQTLSGIVAELASGQQVNSFRVMEAIVALNPEAFINGDMNRMRAGVTLDLPALDGFTPGAPAAARGNPSSVARATPPPVTSTRTEPTPTPAAAGPSRRAPTPADPRLELVGTPTSGEILNSLNNWLDNDDAELGIRAQEARRDLAYAAAEIETYRKENQILRDRVGELEDRLATLRRLVALKAAEEAGAPPVAAVETTVVESEPAATIATPPAETTPAATAPMSVDSELASAAAVTEPDARESGPRWWPWALALLVLIGITGYVLYRGRAEERARAQRTADLVHRIQSAGERPTGEL